MKSIWSSFKRSVCGPVRPVQVAAGLARGVRLELDPADHIRLLLGLYEPSVLPALARALQTAEICYDIGANAGFYSLMFARQPSVREVHAFEPNPRLLEQFDRNLRLNPEAAQKVRAHRIALGSAGEGSLDAQVAAGVPIPDIVKMDVDGPEADILRGAEKILSARRTLWIVETHSAALEEEVAGIFRAHGHRSWYPDGPWWLRFFPEQRPHPPNRHLIAQPLSEPKL